MSSISSTWIILGVLVVLVVWIIMIYNGLVAMRQRVNQSFADIDVQLKQRHDLIPNLVETVKGYAAQERQVLEEVTNARARATQVQIPPDILNNPEAFKRFQEAQQQLGGALGRLLAVSERYPDLKSNQNFLALQSQLEGTENRIAVARRDYIEAVRVYNTELRTFPGVLWASTVYRSHKPMETFTVTEETRRPPAVKF
jgi:LemA protein